MLRVTLSAILLGLLLAAPAGASAPPDPPRDRNAEEQARSLAAKAWDLADRGRFDEAAVALASAKRAAVRAGDPVLSASVGTVEASLAFRRGEFDRAESILAGVEEPVFAQGEPGDRSRWLSVRGSVLWAMNRSEEAFEVFERQATLLHAEGNLYAEASAVSNMALLASRLAAPHPKDSAPWQRVRELVDRARSLAARSGNRAIEAKSHLHLGQLGGSIAEQREHFRAALRALGETGSLDDILLARRLLAESLILRDPRDPAAGFAELREAAALAGERGMAEAEARTAIVLATMHWRLADEGPAGPGVRDEAIAGSLAAMDAVEALRDRQQDDLVRARVFSVYAFFYGRVVGYLLGPPESPPARADVELAFRVAERARAQVFLDQLEVSGLFATLTSSGEAPAGAALWSGIPSLPEVEALLAEDEAALSFQVADRLSSSGYSNGGSWLFLHTRRGTRVYPLPERKEIEPRVGLLLGMIDARDGSEAAGAARLYQDLLSSAIDDLPAGVTRLVVVPDGALHRLPFGLLRPAPDAEPLAARFRIAVVPSLTSWHHWRRGAPRALAGTRLVLADPSPLPDRAAAEHLGPLPFARAEARSIRRALGRGTEVLESTAATEGRARREAAAGPSLLHFATHAVVDEARPEESAILLAPGPGEEDGLIRPSEIPALGAGRRVVVLSGCSSAGGPVLAGEGVLSLARAFFATGAVAVIGSLWPLRDDEAAVFFERFYARWAKGESLAGALAAAQREGLASGAPAAAWAGLVVLGDGEVGLERTAAGEWAQVWPWLLGLAVAAGVGGALLRRSHSVASGAPAS